MITIAIFQKIYANFISIKRNTTSINLAVNNPIIIALEKNKIAIIIVIAVNSISINQT